MQVKSTRNWLTTGVIATSLLLLGCQPTDSPSTKNAQLTWSTNIEGLDDAMLSPDYWLEKLPQPNKVLMTAEQIDAFNTAQFQSQTYLVDPLSYPNALAGEQVKQLIEEISTKPSSDRFYVDGTALTESHYQNYINEMDLSGIAEQQVIQFGITVKRTPFRTFPTLDRVLNKGMDADIDRFQETASFPGEVLTVLHTSANKEWLFVQNYHYRAWVQSKDVALATREQAEQFRSPAQFLVVTGDKVFTTYTPNTLANAQVQLDMGVRLPLLERSALDSQLIERHNAAMGYPVLLPTRDEAGRFVAVQALIPRSEDVNIGYLPFTAGNVISQAFKFLGERYGWGHDFNGRDCTGFIGEIYKTFGLLMPRNSGQQGKAPYGINVPLEKALPLSERMTQFDSMKSGDLVYLPGHVAMVLGMDKGQPFLIHDVHGMSYLNSKGERVRSMLNGVSVTPLYSFDGYLTSIYNIKRIRSTL